MPALPLPAYEVSAFKQWFERLPARPRQMMVVGVAGLIGLFLLCVIGRWYHHSRPTYVLEVLERINSPADVQQESDYLTPQGKDVLLWLQKKAGDKPASGTQVIYSAPVISGNVCDIQFQAGDVTGTVHLLKMDHWRFDDFYVEEIGGKKVELWTSYVKDHPVRAWWSVHGDEMFAAFLKGVVIGASVAK